MTRRDPIAPTLTGLLAELRSPRSREAYEATWTQYVAWCKAERLDVLKARPQDVKRYVAHLHESKKRSTVGQALSIIRMVYGALVTDGVCRTNPAREVKNPKTDAALKTPVLSEDQVRAMFDLIPETWRDHRDAVILRVLFGLGWRRIEVARMKVEDFRGATVTGIVKGSKDITVGVPKWLQTVIEAWKKRAGIVTGALFPREEGSKAPVKPYDVYLVVKRAAVRAGVPLAVATPHAFRRSFITLSGQRGVSLKERQLSVGHSSRATTERYDHAREAAEAAPGEVFAALVKKGGDDVGQD